MKLKLKTEYSQRDSRWLGEILGYNKAGSIYTVGGYGCLITSLCNYLNSVGEDINPSEINKLFKDNGGYVANSGFLIWDKILELFPISYKYTSPWYADPLTDAVLDRMKRYLDDRYALLCEVDFDPNLAGEQMHWVLVIGYIGDEFIIHDPWTGEETKLSVYGDIKKAVYHFKIYSKQLQLFEDEPTSLENTTINWYDHEGNQKTVGYYVGKFEQLSETIESQVKDIQKKNEIIKQYEKQVAGLQSDAISKDDTIGTLKEDIKLLREHLGASEGHLKELKEENAITIEALTKNVDKLTESVIKKDKKIESLQEDLNNGLKNYSRWRLLIALLFRR